MMYYTQVPVPISASINKHHIIKNEDTTLIVTFKNIAAADTVILCFYQKSATPTLQDFMQTYVIVGNHGALSQTVLIPASVLNQGILYVTVSGFDYLPYTDEILVSPGCTKNSTPMVITTTPNFPWSGERFINQDITINSGVTLTITGKVYFVQDCKITVMPGAKLIVDGGKLASSCEALWKGIDIVGNSSLSQFSATNQGFVQITNSGCIKDAKCAISTAQTTALGYTIGTTGGMLSCTNAKFINNKCSIRIYPYQYGIKNYNSNISSADFVKDEKYIGTPDGSAMVIFEGIKGLGTTGLSFISNLPSTTDIDKRGIGILAIDAGFRLNHICIGNISPCSNYRRPYFEGLYYGIRCSSTGAAKFIQIENSDFDNNSRGIYLSAVTNPSITLCTFKTKAESSFNQLTNSSGIYLDNVTTGYFVQENTFTGNYAGITNTYESGIIVNNSGTAPTEIYNNTFTKLQNGITSQDNNLGLVCKCNDYTGVKTDQSVLLSNGAPTTWGIAPSQGGPNSVTDPAGNTFSDRNSSTKDLYNEGAAFDYYHHLPHNPKRVTPLYYSTTVTPRLTNWNYTDKPTACPSKLGGGGGIQVEGLKDELVAKVDSIIEKEIELQAIIDGGNTEETAETIVYSSPPEAIDIRNDLLFKSPFLSDTVMQTAIANEAVLSNTLIHEILLANPQSAISEAVLDKLDARTDPMPENMYNEILSGQEIISALESKETELSGLKAERNQLYNNIVSYYLSDTINSAIDSLSNFLSEKNTLQAKYLLVSLLLQSNDSANMAETLESIPVTFNLNPAETSLHNDYGNYFNLLNHLQNDTLQGLSLDSTHCAYAQALYEQCSEPVRSYMRNLLLSAGVIEYNEPYLVADEVKSIYVKKKHRMGPNLPVATLAVYPNPTSHYFIIEYDLTNRPEAQFSNKLLELSSVQGSILRQIILKDVQGRLIVPITDLRPGMYLITLICGNHNIQSIKLSVPN